jgi:murein DD-endopeptidase MepM/ murein hydrolase activator NlpD
VPLIASVPGATITQGFGPSGLSIEPSMWAAGDVAGWSYFQGASWYDDFHPGIDRSAPTGTAMRAMQDGTVAFAGWRDYISGYQVEVQIRPESHYSVNHLSRVGVRVGQKVRQGDVIGAVGATGATTGPHTHEGVSVDTVISGRVHFLLYDPDLFMAGGRLANDPRIQPEAREVQLNGAGINIRLADEDLFDRESVYAFSRAHGIFRRGTGNRIAPLGKHFPFLRWRQTPSGDFAIVTGFGKRLAIRRNLVHFV